MDDLVARLRNADLGICDEAAAEITRLRDEIHHCMLISDYHGHDEGEDDE